MSKISFQGDVVLYVDGDAVAGDCGTSWSKPIGSLCAALARAAEAGGEVEEIWVKAAESPYLPDVPGGEDPRAASFDLVEGVAIYGGFAGHEMILADRDPSRTPRFSAVISVCPAIARTTVTPWWI